MRLGKNNTTTATDKPAKPKKTRTTTTAKNGQSGVSFDKGGPVYEEPLDAEQIEINRKALEAQLDRLDLMDSTWADKRAGFRASRKELADDIKTIRERLRTGRIKKAAQQTLPGADHEPTVEG